MNIQNRHSFKATWVMLLVACAVRAFAAGMDPMLGAYLPGPDIDDGWSLFVGGDLIQQSTVVQSSVEGRMFVRGDFIATANQWNNEIGSPKSGTGVNPTGELPALVVGGDLLGNGGINNMGFDVQVGSNIASTVSIAGDGDVINGNVDYAAADQLIAQLQTRSRYWASLPSTTNGTITVRWGGAYFEADGANGNPKLWVFNLDFDLTSPLWGADFSGFESGDSILINCVKTGSDETFILGVNSYLFNGVNVDSSFIPNVIWNIPYAKTVTISGHAVMQGSVLVGSSDSVTTVAIPQHQGRFVTCGDLVRSEISTAFLNYPFTAELPLLVTEEPPRALNVSLESEYFEVTFDTEPDAWYELKISESLGAGAQWSSENAQVVHPQFAGGISELKIAIQGAAEGVTTLRIPRNRRRAFFKLVKLQNHN